MGVMYNGTCVSPYSNCSTGMRLFYDRFGEAGCACEEGFYYQHREKRCYREFSAAQCGQGNTWVRKKKGRKGKRIGKCKRTKCGRGMVKFSDGQCRKFKNRKEVGDCEAELQINEKGEVVCSITVSGRGVRTARSRSCRRGYFYNRRLRRCIRAYG